MLKTFPIDFIRQIFEQKLFEEHQKNYELFGGKNQVNIFSFYEQLKSQDEVDRFVETYRDLANQQNRMGLILNGVLLSPENPTITNLYSSTIIPMTWTCSLRSTLENRDTSIVTINNLIKELKGRKVDIAQLDCVDDNNNKYTEPFMVGTIGQNDGEPQLKNGDYIGSVVDTQDAVNVVKSLVNTGVKFDYENTKYFYCENDNKIKVIKSIWSKGEQLVDTIFGDDVLYDGIEIVGSYGLLGEWTLEQLYPNASCSITLYGNENVNLSLDNGEIEILEVYEQNGQKYTKVSVKFTLSDNVSTLCPGFNGTFDIEDVEVFEKTFIFTFVVNDGTITDIVFPPQHTSFEKYKVSFSFDAIRCDEPRNLNGSEFCELTFSGSATLVNNGVALGNDLLKIGVKKKGYQATSYVDLTSTSVQYYLEPLEMPSGSNANTQISQLMSNNFLNNSHTDALSLTLQYTFIYDRNITLLKEWFNYARYGTQGLSASDITPNLEYIIDELWCSWGEFEKQEIITKIVENIDVENTESDTLTLALTMQIQGENH